MCITLVITPTSGKSSRYVRVEPSARAIRARALRCAKEWRESIVTVLSRDGRRFDVHTANGIAHVASFTFRFPSAELGDRKPKRAKRRLTTVDVLTDVKGRKLTRPIGAPGISGHRTLSGQSSRRNARRGSVNHTRTTVDVPTVTVQSVNGRRVVTWRR